MWVPIEAVARKPTAFLRFMHDDRVMGAPGLPLPPAEWSPCGQPLRRGLRGRPATSRSNTTLGNSRISLATTPICHGITR